MNINFTEENMKELLLNISNQTKLLDLMYKGYLDYQNDKLVNQSSNCSNIENKEIEKMRNITKRKDGRYVIRKTINGVRISKYAKTKEEAREILQLFKKNKIKVNRTKKTAKEFTLEEYSTMWLETYKKPFVNTKTYNEIKTYIVKIINALGKIKLKELKTQDIQTFLNRLPINRTKEKIGIYFKAILQKAVDTEVLRINVFNAVIKDKKIVCKNTAYTYAEQEQILKAIKGTDIEHEILTYLMCGCRPNELPKKQNFDFENKLINIYGTKNENAKHRQIEMSEGFSNYMQKYLINNEMQSELYVSRKFRDLCNSVGINNPLLYRLRHTFATNHFTLGTQPKIVQHWLGHSQISMTLDTYTDIDKTSTKEKIEKLYNRFYYISK